MSDLKKGHDILADQVTTKPGVSDVGIEIRRGDERNPGAVSHGYAKVSDAKHHGQNAKRYLHSLVNALKKQPKPNLPKSEGIEPKALSSTGPMAMTKSDKAQMKTKLTKADIQSFDELLRKDASSNQIKIIRAHKEAARQKKLTEHFGAKGQAVPEHLKNPQPTHLDYNSMRAEFKTKNSPAAEMANRNQQARMKPAPAPAPAYSKMHDPTLSGTVKYKQAAPAPAAAQPKLKVAKADVKIAPEQVSDPIIQNRGTVSTPAKISGPAVMEQPHGEKMKKCSHALKSLIGGLKKVDPKTHLPGILMEKKVK